MVRVLLVLALHVHIANPTHRVAPVQHLVPLQSHASPRPTGTVASFETLMPNSFGIAFTSSPRTVQSFTSMSHVRPAPTLQDARLSQRDVALSTVLFLLEQRVRA